MVFVVVLCWVRFFWLLTWQVGSCLLFAENVGLHVVFLIIFVGWLLAEHKLVVGSC